MQCQPIKPSFGIQHPLKQDWKKGLMPQVKYGLYGIPLTKENVTQEHIVPRSCGGETVTENLALADRDMNNERACTPLMDYMTYKQLFDYLYQFVDVKTPNIDGKDYIVGVMKTVGDVERYRREEWIA